MEKEKKTNTNTREKIFGTFENTVEKLLYVCPFCRYNTETPDDIHYHVIGYHKVLSEFFNDY